MKRALFFFTIALLILTPLAGCAQPEKPAETQIPASPTDIPAVAEVEPEDGITSIDLPHGEGTVYYVAMIGNNVWELSAAQNFEKTAKALGYDIKLLNAENSSDNQINQINTIIPLKPKAIFLKSVDVTVIAEVVSMALEAGIPVIPFDGTITSANVPLNVDVGLINYGKTAAEEILKILKSKYGTEKGKVLQLMGDLGVPYSPLMSKGFHEIMDQYPEITIIDKDTIGWEITAAATVASDVLTVNKDLDAMFVHTDSRFPGVVSVLEEQGYKKGDIGLVGVDGDPTAISLIKEGWINATITPPMTAYVAGCFAFLDQIYAGEELQPGKYMIEGAAADLVVEDFGPILYMPGIIITQDNADDPTLWGNSSFD